MGIGSGNLHFFTIGYFTLMFEVAGGVIPPCLFATAPAQHGTSSKRAVGMGLNYGRTYSLPARFAFFFWV